MEAITRKELVNRGKELSNNKMGQRTIGPSFFLPQFRNPSLVKDHKENVVGPTVQAFRKIGKELKQEFRHQVLGIKSLQSTLEKEGEKTEERVGIDRERHIQFSRERESINKSLQEQKELTEKILQSTEQQKDLHSKSLAELTAIHSFLYKQDQRAEYEKRRPKVAFQEAPWGKKPEEKTKDGRVLDLYSRNMEDLLDLFRRRERRRLPRRRTGRAGGIFNKIKRIPSVMGGLGGTRLLAPLAALAYANEMYNITTNETLTEEQKQKEMVKSTNGLVGAFAGAKAGGLLGAKAGTLILPGIGTAIGTALGAIAGSLIGFFTGKKLPDLIKKSTKPDISVMESRIKEEYTPALVPVKRETPTPVLPPPPGRPHVAPSATPSRQPTPVVRPKIEKGKIIPPENIQREINTASKKHGVDPQVMTTVAKMESDFNPQAKNPHSTASGLFQFIKSTGKEYGLNEENKFDVAANTDAAARLMKDNADYLRRHGIEPTGPNLYLAHQQGKAGAVRILKAAKEGRDVTDPRLRRAMDLNAGKGKSPKEFVEYWNRRYERDYAKIAHTPPETEKLAIDIKEKAEKEAESSPIPAVNIASTPTPIENYPENVDVVSSGHPENAPLGYTKYKEPVISPTANYGKPMEPEIPIQVNKIAQSPVTIEPKKPEIKPVYHPPAAGIKTELAPEQVTRSQWIKPTVEKPPEALEKTVKDTEIINNGSVRPTLEEVPVIANDFGLVFINSGYF